MQNSIKLKTQSKPGHNSKEKLFKQEGYLTVDIYQTETKLIIQTAIAGIKSEDLDITIERDLIIIKGNREEPRTGDEDKSSSSPLADARAGDEDKSSSSPLADARVKDYFVQECYWGPFSRKIILPVEINPDQAQSSMKQGVLVIQLPKTLREKKRKIEIKENS